MNGKSAVLLVSGLLFGCVQPQPPAAPPPPPPPQAAAPAPAAPAPPADRIVAIQSANCERLLQLPADDRAAATMFYIGYQASRFRAGIINVSGIPSIASLALSYCQAHPDRPVAEAFAAGYASYLRNRRG